MSENAATRSAMPPPAAPRIYHIVHVDRLPSIVKDGCLWCDAEVQKRRPPGTTIGMSDIKQRRLHKRLSSHQNLNVGDCVPFYFCPRSVMLYVIHKSNHPKISYRGGQGDIVHIESDLYETIEWAKSISLRWTFTNSNAGSSYFKDFVDINELEKINWNAVAARNWINSREEKQAKFLLERQFSWTLVRRIGVHSPAVAQRAHAAIAAAGHQPDVKVMPSWYY